MKICIVGLIKTYLDHTYKPDFCFVKIMFSVPIFEQLSLILYFGQNCNKNIV